MKRLIRLRPITVMAIAVFLVSCFAAVGSFAVAKSSGDRVAGAPPADALNEIRRVAIAIAKENHESAPHSGRLVRTTRKAAVALGGGAVFDEQDAYAVVVRGRFTVDRSAHRSVPPLSASVLMIVFDSSTLQVLDLSFRQTEPDLTRLGDVVPLGL